MKLLEKSHIKRRLLRFIELLYRLLYGRNLKYSVNCFDPVNEDDDFCSEEVIFIVQGPYSSSFPNLLKRLNKYFPSCIIIVSTWLDSKKSFEAHKGFSLVVSDRTKIQSAGILNFNLQRKTTLSGLEWAISRFNRKTRCIKIRADYYPLKLAELVNFIKALESAHPKFRDRMWLPDLNTVTNLDFSIGDIFQVGELGSLYDSWAMTAEQFESLTPQQLSLLSDGFKKLEVLAKYELPEIVFGKAFARSRGKPLTNQGYASLLQHDIGIIDSDQFGFVFDKYGWERNGRKVSRDPKKYAQFSKWVCDVFNEA